MAYTDLTMKLCREFEAGEVVNAQNRDVTLQLMRNGRPTGVSVHGASIDAQFAVQPGFLLFTTDHIPYEEPLHITLLDSTLRRLDEIELSAAYNTGSLEILETESTGDAVEFRFFGDDRWHLEVLERPRYLLPFSPFSPVKRRSSLPFRGQLRIERRGP